MRRRYLLFLTLIFPVMAGAIILVYQSTHSVALSQLRKDRIPSGAYVVPWMEPSPSIANISGIIPQQRPWNIDGVMTGALRIEMTFHIDLPNGTRTVPAAVYLAHDGDYLYFGAILHGMYANPTSTSKVQWADYIHLLFDVENGGYLTSPEAGSWMGVYVGCPFVNTTCDGGGWHSSLIWTVMDEAWYYYTGSNRYVFWEAQVDCKQPQTLGNMATEYNLDDGTVVMLFSRRLSMPGSCADALQMKAGERWVMGFLIEAGYTNGNPIPTQDPLQDWVDGWPMKDYPYPNNSSSTWPKLAIDLSNPPSGFAIRQQLDATLTTLATWS